MTRLREFPSTFAHRCSILCSILVAPLLLLYPNARYVRASGGETVHVSVEKASEAKRLLDQGELDDALKLLEQALAELPAEPGYAPLRARIILQIVEVQRAGFLQDGDLERLWTAKRTLDRFLGPLDLLDEQGRAEAEERRNQLVDEISRLEIARRQARMERESMDRQNRSMMLRKRAQVLVKAGTAVTLSAMSGLSLIGIGAALGRKADERLDALDSSSSCMFESPTCGELYEGVQKFRGQGNRGNALVLSGAVIGATLLVAGTTLLFVARRDKKKTISLEIQPTITPVQKSAGVTLLGRF